MLNWNRGCLIPHHPAYLPGVDVLAASDIHVAVYIRAFPSISRTRIRITTIGAVPIVLERPAIASTQLGHQILASTASGMQPVRSTRVRATIARTILPFKINVNASGSDIDAETTSFRRLWHSHSRENNSNDCKELEKVAHVSLPSE